MTMNPLDFHLHCQSCGCITSIPPRCDYCWSQYRVEAEHEASLLLQSLRMSPATLTEQVNQTLGNPPVNAQRAVALGIARAIERDRKENELDTLSTMTHDTLIVLAQGAEYMAAESTIEERPGGGCSSRYYRAANCARRLAAQTKKEV